MTVTFVLLDLDVGGLDQGPPFGDFGLLPGPECLRRGLSDDEFFVGWIDSCGFEVGEEVEPRLHHYDGYDDEDS